MSMRWFNTISSASPLPEQILGQYKTGLTGTLTVAQYAPPVAKVAMPLPKPISIDDEFNRLELEEHAALCKELGVYSDSVAKIGELELRQYLRERDIQVYDYKSVMDYLKSIAPETPQGLYGTLMKQSVVWKPLRDADLKHHSAITANSKYTRPVPIHVLQLVRDMERERPNQLYFSVSDYEAKNPDPFLAVTTRSFSPWPALVIAHWDEPTYKVKLETAPTPPSQT